MKLHATLERIRCALGWRREWILSRYDGRKYVIHHRLSGRRGGLIEDSTMKRVGLTGGYMPGDMPPGELDLADRWKNARKLARDLGADILDDKAFAKWLRRLPEGSRPDDHVREALDKRKRAFLAVRARRWDIFDSICEPGEEVTVHFEGKSCCDLHSEKKDGSGRWRIRTDGESDVLEPFDSRIEECSEYNAKKDNCRWQFDSLAEAKGFLRSEWLAGERWQWLPEVEAAAALGNALARRLLDIRAERERFRGESGEKRGEDET